jgi:Kef-type K+ transport system membrane component KefB
VIAGSSVADFGAVILLSLFFSGDSSSVGSTLLLIGAFVVLVAAIGITVAEIEHLERLNAVLRRLQDTSAQIRVRGVFLFLIGFAVLAQLLGLEIILGAFIAGTVLRLVEKAGIMTHPLYEQKLEAVGFGVFILFFFVVSGMQLDVGTLLAGGGAALAPVPVFLLALLLARGLLAILYRPQVGTRGVLAAALLQATSLPFIVATTGIGMELASSVRLRARPSSSPACSPWCLLFPLGALTLLRGDKRPSAQ